MFFFCIKSLYIFLWNLEYYGFLESGPKNRQTIQISQKMVVSSYSGFVDVVASIQSFEGKCFWRHLVFAFSKKLKRDSNFSTILLVMSFLVVFLLTYLFFSCLCLHWRNERHFLEKQKYLSVLHQTHTTLESSGNNINADI